MGDCELKARGPIRFCYLDEMMFVVRREPSEELAAEFRRQVEKADGAQARKRSAHLQRENVRPQRKSFDRKASDETPTNEAS
jgi:hypothetical protein